MADSTKSTVVIASVLKPVDDSRMYEKIGLTLANSGKYDVHVIGIEGQPTETPGITSHPLRPFGRLSPRRLLAHIRILLIALRLRPRIFVITTHELLCAALLVKLIRGSKLIYDVQENYYWNILYTRAFPLLAKPFVALYVRLKENLSAPFIEHFLLAERGYEEELKFPRTRYTVIENKVRAEPHQRKTPAADRGKETINLLFSGTIAESTGVFTAIDLAVKLHVIDDRIRLTIIGFCSQSRVLEKIRLLIRPRPFIQLIARDAPIPHREIFNQIREADFGMVTYQINPSTMNSVPTKLYEYLGLRLPVLLVSHKPWVDFCHRSRAAVVFNPDHYNAADILREMLTGSFYTSDPVEVYWESEEPRLLECFEQVRR